MTQGLREERYGYKQGGDYYLGRGDIDTAITYFIRAIAANEMSQAEMANKYDLVREKVDQQPAAIKAKLQKRMDFFYDWMLNHFTGSNKKWSDREVLNLAQEAFAAEDYEEAAQFYAKVDWSRVAVAGLGLARNNYYQALMRTGNNQQLAEVAGDFLAGSDKSLSPVPLKDVRAFYDESDDSELEDDLTRPTPAAISDEMLQNMEQELIKSYQMAITDYGQALAAATSLRESYRQDKQTDKLADVYKVSSYFQGRIAQILTIFVETLAPYDAALADEYRGQAEQYQKLSADSLAQTDKLSVKKVKTEEKQRSAVNSSPKTASAAPAEEPKPLWPYVTMLSQAVHPVAVPYQESAADVKKTLPHKTQSPVVQPTLENANKSVVNSFSLFRKQQRKQLMKQAKQHEAQIPQQLAKTGEGYFNEVLREDGLEVDRRLGVLLTTAIAQYKTQYKWPEEAQALAKADAFVLNLRNQGLLAALEGVVGNTSLGTSIGKALVDYYLDDPASRAEADPNKFIAELIDELQAAKPTPTSRK